MGFLWQSLHICHHQYFTDPTLATALHSIVSQYMEEIGDFDQNVDMGLISTSISPDMHLHISQAVSLTLPIKTCICEKSHSGFLTYLDYFAYLAFIITEVFH